MIWNLIIVILKRKCKLLQNGSVLDDSRVQLRVLCDSIDTSALFINGRARVSNAEMRTLREFSLF